MKEKLIPILSIISLIADLLSIIVFIGLPNFSLRTFNIEIPVIPLLSGNFDGENLAQNGDNLTANLSFAGIVYAFFVSVFLIVVEFKIIGAIFLQITTVVFFLWSLYFNKEITVLLVFCLFAANGVLIILRYLIFDFIFFETEWVIYLVLMTPPNAMLLVGLGVMHSLAAWISSLLMCLFLSFFIWITTEDKKRW